MATVTIRCVALVSGSFSKKASRCVGMPHLSRERHCRALSAAAGSATLTPAAHDGPRASGPLVGPPRAANVWCVPSAAGDGDGGEEEVVVVPTPAAPRWTVARRAAAAAPPAHERR